MQGICRDRYRSKEALFIGSRDIIVGVEVEIRDGIK